MRPSDAPAQTAWPVGKLPARSLQQLLSKLPQNDARVLLGPRFGEDAALLEAGDRCLVVATDPVTFATDRIGWYAVHVNANDVVTLGATPRWFFMVLLLPERDATHELADAIVSDVVRTCEQLGVTVCGGHTEITPGLDRPIVVGQMIGEVSKSRVVRKDAVRMGDRVLLTRGVAIEGTAILAREMRDLLVGRVDEATIDRAAGLLFEPGIGVTDAALAALEAGIVRAMHDPTEGGVQSGLAELAAACGASLRVHTDRIPVLPETRTICDVLGVDPLRLMASGALLLVVPVSSVDPITTALGARGIPVAVIAEIGTPTDTSRMLDPQGGRPLVPAERDELARILGERKT